MIAQIITGITALTLTVAIVNEVAERPEHFLKAGNILTFDRTAEGGTKRSYTLTIDSVLSKGGTSTIIATRTDGGDSAARTSRYWYFCNADSWCVDPLNFLNQPAVTNNETNAWAPLAPTSSESDSLIYPFQMKVGDSLPDAHAEWSSRSPRKFTRHSETFTKRVVVAVDTLTTSFGKIAAFRITCDVGKHITNDYGQASSPTHYTRLNLTEWFHPQYGVVKSERKDQRGESTETLLSIQ